MKKWFNTIVCVIGIIGLLGMFSSCILAVDSGLGTIRGITLLREIPVPERLNLTITEQPSERLYFQQYFVSENDWFLLNSRDMDRSTEEDASQVYIDIYDDNGVFQKTICYTSQSYDSAELNGSMVIIYLASTVIFVDLNTDIATAYEIETFAASEAGVEKALNKKVQSTANWEYRSKGNVYGEHTLIRNNETAEETLVDLPGIGISLFEHFASLGFVVVMLFGLSYVKKRTCMKKENAEQSSFKCEQIE